MRGMLKALLGAKFLFYQECIKFDKSVLRYGLPLEGQTRTDAHILPR